MVHAVLGATSQALPNPSLAVPATEHSSVALGLRTKLRFVNACPRPWQVVRSSKSFAFRRLCRSGACPRLGLCMPSLARPRGFANPQPCHPWQVVRSSKSFAFCRLRRPGLTHPWQVVRPSKSFAFRRLCRPSLTHPWRKGFGFANPQPCWSSRQAQLGAARDCAGSWRFLNACPRPWQVVRSSKRCFVGCADRVLALDLVCARHPWRDREASLTPSLAIHGKSFGPRKALLFVGFADRASPIHGATSQALPNPSLAVPATEHSSVALGLRTKLRFVNACPRPWQVVRSSKSFAFSRLRRPGLTLTRKSPTALFVVRKFNPQLEWCMPSLARLLRLC